MTLQSPRYGEPPTDEEIVFAFRFVLAAARKLGAGIEDRRNDILPAPDLHPQAPELREKILRLVRVAEVMEYMEWADSMYIPGSIYDTMVLRPEIKLVVCNIAPPPPPNPPPVSQPQPKRNRKKLD